MAKKEKLKTGDFDLDLELSFDDFNEAAIDGKINPEVNKKGSRKVISDVFKGTISGAGSKVKDPSFIRELTKKALPSTYGEIADNVDKVAGTASELYDGAVKEIKPQLSRIAHRVDKLIPNNAGKLKKATSKFAKWLGGEEPGSAQASKEQVQDQSIAIGLAQIFASQEDNKDKADAQRKANEQIESSIKNRQFQSSIGVLTNISDNIGRLTQYNDKVNQSVQKKSIELQYRQLFALKDIADTNKQYMEVFKAQLEAIAKNTSLPEFVKINNSERFKDLARTKFMDKVQDSFFGKGSAIDRGLGKIKKDLEGYIGGIKNGLESASMGLDGLEQVKELNETLVEMGMEPISGAELAGNAAGGFIADKVGSKAMGWIKKKTEKNKKLNDFLHKGAGNLANFSGTANDIKNSDKMTEASIGGGMKGIAADQLDKVLGYFGDSKPDSRINNPYATGNIKGAAIFDEKSQRSLVDVIPGYLSRILREITVFRTGNDNVGLTMFDHDSGKFVSKHQMGESIKKKLSKDIKLSGYGYVARNVGGKFTEGENVNEDEQSKVTAFLSKLSAIPNMSFTPEKIMSTTVFRELDPNTQKLVKAILSKKVTDHEDKEKGQYELTKNVMALRNKTPDIRGSIEALIGNGYGDILQEHGLVKREENGDYSIDEKAYLEMVREHSGIITSDETAKKDIKKISGKSALDGIRSSPVYNWQYKQGKGDGKNHTGPMAQKIKSKFGDVAAPGGVKIDLTSMNGNNMAAIQELAEQQDKLKNTVKGKTGETGSSQIVSDVSAIRKLLESGKVGIGGSGSHSADDGTYSGIMGAILSGATRLIGKSTSDAFHVGKQAVDKVIGTGKDLYDEHKDTVISGFQRLLSAAGDAATKALKFGQDIVFNKLPEGWKKAQVFAGKVKEQVLKWYNSAKDVYVEGRDGPVLRAALIRAGYYRDSVTGKVIQSMDDLANLKGDVVNKAGEVVLSIEEASKGLYDQYGEMVKTSLQKLADNAMKLAGEGFTRAKEFWNKAKEKGMGLFSRGKEKAKDLYGKAKNHGKHALGKLKNIDGFGVGFGGEKIYQVLVEIRGILRNEDTPRHEDTLKSHKTIPSVQKVVKPEEEKKHEPTGGTTTTTTESSSEQHGPQPQAETKYANGEGGGALGSIMSLGSKIPGILGGAKSALGTIGAGVKGASGVKGKSKALFGGLAGGLKGLFSKGEETPKEHEEQPEQHGPHQEQHGPQIPMLYKPVKKTTIASQLSSGGKHAFNDKDGRGRRDGSWRDRLDAQKKADDEHRAQKPDNTPGAAKYVSDKDIFQSIKDKAAGFIGGAGKLLSAASSVLSMGMGAGGLLGKLAGGMGKLFGLARGASAVATGVEAASAVGTAAQVAGKVGLLSRLGGALGMVRNVATVGALATGGASSVVFGALSAGLSAVGAVLSSPVVLGAIAVAAVGYGVYKLYKYATRDNVDDFEAIRMKQYGIGTGATDSKYNHYMLVLEAYLNDGRVGYDSGKAYLLEKKIDSKDLLDIFSIDKEDTEGAQKFSQWFQQRFKPFFLTHKTALFSVNNKAKLEDVKTLKPDEQIKYLNLISYESGPYDSDISPFKDLEHLNTDSAFALYAVKSLVKKISASIKVDMSKVKPDQVPLAAFPLANKAPIKPVTPPVLPNTNLAANVKKDVNLVSTPGEDGPMKETGPTGNDSGLSKSSKLKVADGPVRDGSAGMQYIKLGNGVKLDNMNPAMLKNLLSMAQEYGEKTGKAITVTSGVRSSEEQAELYRKNPKKAAPPGRSLHEFGLAADISSGDLSILEDMGLMRKYGFTRPVGGEPWHMEAAGIQTNISMAKDNSDFASQAIAASLFKGGSGVGSIEGSPMGRRDSAFAVSLFDDSATSVKDKINGIASGTLTPAKLPTAASDSKDASNAVSTTDTSVGDTQTAAASKIDIKKAKSSLVSNNDSDKYSKSNAMPDSEPSSVGKTSVTKLASASDDGPAGDIKAQITTIASKQGVDPKDMMTLAAVESSLDPNAKASGTSAKGLYQFTNTTWNERLAKTSNRGQLSDNPSPFNVNDATLMASDYFKSNKKLLSSVKKDVNVTDVYFAHFLGPTGARKFLSSDPDAIAANILPSAADSNKSIFYDGSRPRTVSEVYKLVDQRLKKKANDFGISLSGNNSLSSKPGSKNNSNAPLVQPVDSSDNDSGDVDTSTSSNSTSKAKVTPLEQSGSQSNDDYVPKPAPVVRPRVAPVPQTSIQTDDSGRSANVSSPFDKFNSIDATLGESLNVQKDMCGILNKILDAVNKGGTDAPAKQETPRQVAPSQQPKSPQKMTSTIDLQRRA